MLVFAYFHMADADVCDTQSTEVDKTWQYTRTCAILYDRHVQKQQGETRRALTSWMVEWETKPGSLEGFRFGRYCFLFRTVGWVGRRGSRRVQYRISNGKTEMHEVSAGAQLETETGGVFLIERLHLCDALFFFVDVL